MTRFYRLMVATAAIFGVTSAARADGPASGEVTGVSVQPSPGRADVIVNVRGAVEVRDFMLENPNRLVLDVVGAKLKGNSTGAYDGVKRGGVMNLRYSQFAPDVVRIVMDLDRTMDYHVERLADAIRVSFGTDESFLAWSSNDPELILALFADDCVFEDVTLGVVARLQRGTSQLRERRLCGSP